MSSGNFPYFISITGDTSAWRPAATEVKSDLVSLKTLTIEWGNEGAKANQLNVGAMRGMIWGTQLLLMYGGFLYQNMIREELATMSLETAQENYNKAIREYGTSSEEAVRAGKNLERQTILVGKANQMSGLMMISFGLQFASTVGLQVLPALTKWITSTDVLLAKQVMLHALSGPAGWALLAGGLTAGAVAGYAISQSFQNNVNVNVTANGSNGLNQAFDEAERRATYLLRRN